MAPNVLAIDRFPNQISFGNLAETTENTFRTLQIPDAIISPDIVVDGGLFDGGGFKIEDVLVWDVHLWEPFTDAGPDITGGEGLAMAMNAGMTKDNSTDGSGGPSADTAAEETRPGSGNAASFTKYVHRWGWQFGSNEQQDATGQINRSLSEPQKRIMPQLVVLGPAGKNYGEVLTAAHYHHWLQGQNLSGLKTFQNGVQARRVQVDFDELMFDRETLLGILGLITSIVV